MKNIAIFVDNLNVGGIQKSVVNLLNNVDYSKYNIDLYIFNKNNFYELPQKTNLIYLKKPSKIYKIIPFNIVYKFYKPKILKKKYNLSIDFDSYQMHTAIGALKCDSEKKAIWIHNDIPIKLKEEFKYRILHFFFKEKYKRFDIYNAVSAGALTSFKTLHKNENKEFNVIPNYINTNEIKEKLKEKVNLKVDNSKVNIITVGRLCHQKGIDIMLNELNELLKYRDDIHLYIVGDGEERKKLEKITHNLKINKYVTFLGNQKNPFKYMKKMDLFYLSSRYEGQGMVILEALSVGLDILIPKHLEKYCPNIKGENDTLSYLKKYNKPNKKEYNDLKDYNSEITKKINKMFQG